MAIPPGYTIPPIPVDEYVPKLNIDVSQYRTTFPQREGAKPETTQHQPHQQVNQHADPAIWDALHSRCFSLPDVVERESAISVSGARGIWLAESAPEGPPDAFLIEREFAHIHPRPDASMHLQLPVELALFAVGAGWAEVHPLAWIGVAPPNRVMLFAPRNEEELDVIARLVEESYRFARGEARTWPGPAMADSPAP